MNNKRVIIAAILLVIALLPAWIVQKKKEAKTESRILIAASIYPWAETARYIGGGAVLVENITPDGVEAHDYEPTVKDLQKIKEASVFIYNGRGMDPWAEKIMREYPEKKIVSASTIDKSSSNNDPHVWLNFKTMIQVGESVKNALAEVDPDNKNVYEQNYNNYKELLIDTEKEYSVGLSNCKLDEAISSHNAFGQLALNYGIKMNYVSDTNFEGEPSAKKIAELTKRAKAEKLKYIYYESLGDKRPIERIASEAGLVQLELNPVEGLTSEQKERGENYFTLVKQNLNNLRTGLLCQ